MSFKKFTKLFISIDDVSAPTSIQRIINQLQANIENSFAPLVGKIQNDNNILQNIQLRTGTNIINHKLGRNLIGWNLIRQRAAANVYDNQDANLSPDLTLILISSADVVVDLQVF